MTALSRKQRQTDALSQALEKLGKEDLVRVSLRARFDSRQSAVSAEKYRGCLPATAGNGTRGAGRGADDK